MIGGGGGRDSHIKCNRAIIRRGIIACSVILQVGRDLLASLKCARAIKIDPALQEAASPGDVRCDRRCLASRQCREGYAVIDIPISIWAIKRNILSSYSCTELYTCLLYTSPSPRDQRGSRMPSSA